MTDPSRSTAPRARTMRFQGVVNRIVRGLLAAPLLSRVVGQRLISVHVVGRKSGRRFTVPVAYTRHHGALLIGTSFAWARNLRTGEPVEVRYLGKLRTADVRVHTDEADVVRRYDAIARDNRQFAAFNGIGFDADGAPRAEDLHAARASGARVLELTVPS
ncbi:nitroreductase/quinone reductase family protein [Pseudonocardia lacus]|uniref:nitroreductase/quinone reductase family protein n=1 Tax=Pseudonocardia lacus TaxID=2835865 RepID=UPI001BDC9E49|nr:nitroreductase/quinone reductase family protein [Pseudonocardia lacus]